ncbi:MULTISPECIES: SurA N-terminal domain-containing protein [Methanocalculus]|uniref:SurA N-terminal domain-containing protein n=1 Tax=Methanocalculus TaxID=71151 RepID=UPI00209D01CE|nr:MULTISPECIES: SurA N-terminal domain-containing protein [unclassified Methanocalculus]MCP1662471.1 hypothetical protein [Methanocalculus sp. AMF5]
MMKRVLIVCLAAFFLLAGAFTAGCTGEEPVPGEEPIPIGDPGDMDDPGGVMDPTAPEENGFEEARPHLEQQLMMETEQRLIDEHLQTLMAEADIEQDDAAIADGADDAAIAVVNGEEIQRSAMVAAEEQELEQLRMMGFDTDAGENQEMMQMLRLQVVDNLIATTLVSQKAADAGIAVTDEDVQDEYQQLAAQFGGEEQLNTELEQAGMTKEDLQSDIKTQLPINRYLDMYLEENLDAGMLDFSEEELRALYEQQQQQAGFEAVEA